MNTPKTASDWNDLWVARQAEHTLEHDAEYWNKRAKTFTTKDNPGSYTDRFLQLADIYEGDKVLDMGCGTGNLSIPLGKDGHNIVAADFSDVMLQRLEDAAQQHGIASIETKQLSWDDDWTAAGMRENDFDVCLASRSINTSNLRDALGKLSRMARRRCCITLPAGPSPHIDGRMLKEIGIECSPSYDSIYALAILQGEGYEPELSYIDTLREDEFDSFDAAMGKYRKMTNFASQRSTSCMSDSRVERRLEEWLEQELVVRASAERPNESVLVLRRPRHVSWAFVSWNLI